MNLYRTFVVRCWQEQAPPNELPVWRFALVQVGESQVPRGFANYDEMAAFLKSQLVGDGAVAPEPPREN